jgi:N-acetylglutamate synthase-like GNAT family acetyltransferase
MMQNTEKWDAAQDLAASFTIRDACDADKELIDYYAAVEGMDVIPGLDNVRVAVNADDVCIGFVRLNYNSQCVAHINPVVVYEPWRRYGVGRALVQEACNREGEIRLVARGSSYAFYKALGFKDCPWKEIEPGVSEECDGCALRSECNPVPMKWTADI